MLFFPLLLMNCLSLFDLFVELALRGLRSASFLLLGFQNHSNVRVKCNVLPLFVELRLETKHRTARLSQQWLQ